MTGSATGADTRTKLLEGALRTLADQDIAKTSARAVAAAAGVNQAQVFYHFGSVDELLAAACRYGAEQRVARHRERLAAVTTLAELVTCGRELHEGVDPDGAARAFEALEQLAELAGVLDELGPVARRAVRHRLRRTGKA